MQFPALETNRLLLTEIVAEDASSIFDLFSCRTVIEYYDLDVFTSLEQANDLIRFFRARYESASGIRWAIREKQANALIGTLGFNSWNGKMKNAVIGYDLLPAYWGNGYACESVRAIIHAAFSGGLSCGPLHRIQADTVPGNVASEALLRRVGFKEEGLRRESGFWKNAFHDLKCFGLLKSDFY